MFQIHIKDIERLPEAAAQFIKAVEDEREARRNRGEVLSNVFAFEAPMGAGKTTFISEVCRRLGSDDEAGSPTFSIVNEYDTERWGRVYHLDCYRIESEEEAYETGVEDYFDSGNPCLVEWPDRIGSLLPDDALRVSIAVNPDSSRVLEMNF